MSRFFALRWTPIDRDGEREGRALLAALERARPWRRLIDWRGLVLLIEPQAGASAIALEGDYGGIFGTVFERESGARVMGFNAGDAAALSEDGGAHFLARYWGAYVAILIDRGRDLIHIFRDPTGAGACFHARCGSVHVLFSDARDFATIRSLEPDLTYLGGFLVNPTLTLARTGLKGVTELQAGERLTLGRTSEARTWLWRADHMSTPRPWEFAAAAATLRDTASRCIGAWSQSGAGQSGAGQNGCGKILHRLSGGLDSSLVLALLRRCAPEADIICVTEYAEAAPEGDEREYARLAAAQAKAPLIELMMTPSRVAYERALSAPFAPKPALALLSFADRTLADVAEDLGARLIISGQAGDHLFHRRRTPLIAADAVRDGLNVAACAKVAMETARLCGVSVWEVWAAMVTKGMLRRPLDIAALLQRAAPLTAADVGVRALAEWASHDWLTGARGLGPARALRVWHYLDALRYHAPSVLTEAAPTQPVLLSQPLAEFCLSVAPYVMTAGGRERSLARAAFANDLPSAIARRSTKGESTRYFTAVLRRNYAVMRELLLGGELEHHGLVQRERLETLLRREFEDGGVVEGMLACVAGEIWLRNLKRVNADVVVSQRAQPQIPNQASLSDAGGST